MTTRKLLTSTSSIEDVSYCDLLSKSLLDYSVSAIVDRAVPDARDGLKPVQRRILYAMYKENNVHSKPYKKTAKISGIVSGNYHPHGSSGIDGAVVTMAQPFKKAATLVDGQGNFGSVEGDSAAASRYTEIRLSTLAEKCYLDMLQYNAVDFQSNYDGTLQEPVVLPALLPMVLLTGAEGIAVGMRTDIPTFNFNEVADANIFALTHKNVTAEKVLEKMPAPDFASGGVICNASDMEQMYETGKGKVRIRGQWHLEKGNSKQKDKLVITSVPYTIVGSGIISFMQSVVDLIESKKLLGVTDVIDQTGTDVRIVLELSKNADVDYIVQVLCTYTKLEDTYSCNMLVVDDGTPKVLGVVDILKKFCTFQKQLYTRKYTYLVNRLVEKQSELQAYVACCTNADKFIGIVKSSNSVADAKSNLMEQFNFTEQQATSAIALRVQRLVKLEVSALKQQLDVTEKQICKYKEMLQDDGKLVRSIVSDIKAVKKACGYPRKTELANVPAASVKIKEKPAQDVYVLCDRFGYMHCIDENAFARNEQAVKSDFKFWCKATDKSKVALFGSNGEMCRIKVKDIPFGALRTKGSTVDALTKNKYSTHSNSIVGVVNIRPDVTQVVCITEHGMCKMLDCKQVDSSRTCSKYFALNAEIGDSVCVVESAYKLTLLDALLSDNRHIVVNAETVPAASRASAGVKLVDTISPSTTIRAIMHTSGRHSVSELGQRGVKLTSKKADELLAKAKQENRLLY